MENISIATIRRRLHENKIQWRNVQTKPTTNNILENTLDALKYDTRLEE